MASKTRIFFLNALSLTTTALIMRGVSVIFNIYVSNRAGSEAMGLFSLLTSVYGFSITIATASINLGATRLISDALGLGDVSLAKRSAKKAILACTVTGSVAALLLFVFSDVISKYILGDMRAAQSLRVLALTLVPVAISSCLSGYFTAVRRVKVHATFQIVTQFVKIGVTVFLLSFMVDLGTEQACMALVLGGAAAEFISLLISFLLYLRDLRILSRHSHNTREVAAWGITGRGILKKLLTITLPVTLSACIRSALSMFQHVLVPRGLCASGSSWSEALSSYGYLHGMALPLILFPSAFISAFAGLLIPEVSEFCVQKDSRRLGRVSYRALTMSLIFSVGVSGIMIFFSHDIGLAVYKSPEVSQYIRIIAPLIPVMYIDSAADAVLKGSGHQLYSMNVNIADVLTACILALTLIPKLGIWGYIISIYATEILNTTLSVSKMISVSKMKPRIFHQVVMPIICIIGATNISNLLMQNTQVIGSRSGRLVFQIFVTSAIYIVLLLLTRTLGKDESELLNASLLSQKQYDRKFRSALPVKTQDGT